MDVGIYLAVLGTVGDVLAATASLGLGHSVVADGAERIRACGNRLIDRYEVLKH